jgi:hypothetical protein
MNNLKITNNSLIIYYFKLQFELLVGGFNHFLVT